LRNKWGKVNIGLGSELGCAAARVGKQVTIDQSIDDCIGAAVCGSALAIDEYNPSGLSLVDIYHPGHENGEGKRVAVNSMERHRRLGPD
jgi:hypothetical protein